jgi:thiosulfate/3-mercaptopyruvate sulfurtransferase
LGRAGIAKSTPVVAYDAGDGAYAARLWWLLRWLGHSRVCVLDGGWGAWEAQERPRSTDVPQFPEEAYVGEPNRDLVVTTEEVGANLGERRFVLLDARGARRFAGLEEPIDPVAGHIPGAVNRPYTQNLEGGRFKSAQQLRAEFTELLGGATAAVVHQCGSGVTACHNLLAMEHAQLQGSRLYVGSWSEWCSDPSRPVER